MSRYNRNNVVSGCQFTETGDSAICFVGDFALSNGTLRGFPFECRAENNLIHNCGIFGKQIAGIHISRSKRISASHNLTHNMPRAGICIGDGTWGGHVIEYNNISIGVSMKLREGGYRKVHNNIWYNSLVAVAIHTGNENNHDRYLCNITVMLEDYKTRTKKTFASGLTLPS